MKTCYRCSQPIRWWQFRKLVCIWPRNYWFHQDCYWLFLEEWRSWP